MVSMKPTAEDAIKYLSSRTNDRTFLHKDGMIFEQFGEQEPLLMSHCEELHWMKNGVVGARGYALWSFDNRLPAEPKKEEVKQEMKITMPRTGTKMERVVAIVKANASFEVKELLPIVMKECEMGEAGARTYIYNARKGLS